MKRTHDAGLTEGRAGMFPLRPVLGDSGVTLIELIVVVTIIAVLVLVGGIEFVGWQANYRIESQGKEMYADIMNARSRAMQRNRMHFIVVTADNYQTYEDTNENGVLNIGTDVNWWPNPKPFNYPSLQAGQIIIDTRGLVSTNPPPPANVEAYIRFNYDTTKFRPDYDCISLGATGTAAGVIPGTRINMGKWDGAVCVAS